MTLDLPVPPESSIHSASANVPNKLPPIPILCGTQDKALECVANVDNNENHIAKAEVASSECAGSRSNQSERPTAKFAPTDRAAAALNFVREHTPFTPPLDDQEERGVADKFESALEDDLPPDPSLSVSESEQPPVTTEGEGKGDQGVTVGAGKEVAAEEEEVKSKLAHTLSGEDDSSGSSLSDNDWLDEDLLPRR